MQYNTDNAQRQSSSGPSIRPKFQHPGARVGGEGAGTEGVVRVLAVLVHVCWVRAYDTLLIDVDVSSFFLTTLEGTLIVVHQPPLCLLQGAGSNTISILLGTAASCLIHANVRLLHLRTFR